VGKPGRIADVPVSACYADGIMEGGMIWVRRFICGITGHWWGPICRQPDETWLQPCRCCDKVDALTPTEAQEWIDEGGAVKGQTWG
jgi:hypothetical protein